MKLSIITINYNNAEGLRKTLASVASQTYTDIEHIIVDGGSTDGSVEIIEAYSQPLPEGKGASSENNYPSQNPLHRVIWISEKDSGIYNAMNKGIEIALGRRNVNADHTSEPLSQDFQHSTYDIQQKSDYIQILNSGDILAADDVTERMFQAMGNGQWAIDNENNRQSPIANGPQIPIFYGNMIKVNAAGKVVGKSGYTEYSLRQFYSSTLNHDCAYIRRDLFEEYGLYDEQLKIVSDWKWYLQAIGLGRVKPEYVDIDVTIFDDGGISETNLALRNAERRKVLEEVMPPAILWDYDTHAFEMEQMKRLRRWKMYGLVYLLERTLFKLEKWGVLRR